MKYSKLLFPCLALGIASPLAAQITNHSGVSPYGAGSATDQALRFNGTPGTVNANLPGLTVAIAYNNTTATGTGSGWNLSARGGTAIGAVFHLGTSRAQTVAGSGNLRFNTVTTGLNNLAGVSLTQTWEAEVTLTDSTSWNTVDNEFVYSFQYSAAGLLDSLETSLFSAISLVISDNVNTTTYSGGTLLALFGSSGTGQAAFNYDSDNGPLKIKWSASAAVDADLLNILTGNGGNALTIGNSSVFFANTPVPEPSSLLLGSLALLGLIRRRRSA